jgi:phosphoribosylaminoimidazolecarboxamide formyltransferase/IMP cyclohydrolase
MSVHTIRRALISVSDKAGIVQFAKALMKWNVEIISTGGTLKTLREGGIPAKSVSDVTGFPEILDGRVKTLHPKIHAGLLAVSDNPSHQKQLAELDISSIDLVVVNLYPFEQTISKNGISVDEAIEQIDIGGPTMIRAAAKNHKYKTVVVNPERYTTIIEQMEKNNGAIPAAFRAELAREVFQRTAQYDDAIASYLSNVQRPPTSPSLPDTFSLSLRKHLDLRYGENPHQKAGLYGSFGSYFEHIHGKELSYNNIVDIQAAVELMEEFEETTAVIVKHTNPSGVGSDPKLTQAYSKAFATDMKSAFGGIVAVNRPLDLETARAINDVFTEVIIAPEYPTDVLEFLRKKKDRRLVRQTRPIREAHRIDLKAVAGGLLVQTADDMTLTESELKVVTKRKPTETEFSAMRFAWRVAKHVKSNAIVYARTDRTIGVGAGQMSRVDSAHIAVVKAHEAGLDLRDTAVASDAFFPFADGLLEAVKAGATAVIQPGGSVRDEEVIKAANDNDIAMVFTGIRHFRH